MPALALSPGRRIDGISRIAVLRANALGDYLFAVPALQALRAAYPNAEIVLLGATWHAEFLTGRPGPVDRVLVVPYSSGVRQPPLEEVEDPRQLAAFFEMVRAERFDLAIQMHGGGRYSNPFIKQLGARCTVGLRTPDAASLDLDMHYAYYQPETVRFLELVGLVGAQPVALEPRITVTERDCQEARQALAGLASPLVAVHPGATDPRRRWPAERFAKVADQLAERGASVVVTGSAAEHQVVEAVAAQMRHPARSLVDAVSIGGLAATYRSCELVLSNDTGPRHLAQAVGAPTVGIYWCGNLINAGPLTRRRNRPHISWTVHCPICGADCTAPELPAPHSQPRCEHDTSFVASVCTDAVLADAIDLLTPPPRPLTVADCEPVA